MAYSKLLATVDYFLGRFEGSAETGSHAFLLVPIFSGWVIFFLPSYPWWTQRWGGGWRGQSGPG